MNDKSNARWLPVWAKKATEPINAASGRSSYGPSHTRLLVEDAMVGLQLRPGDTLLDVGCAKGLMGEMLAPMVKRYVGVDPIADMVHEFKQRCGVEAYVASATDLSMFKDGEFTKTLLSSVLLIMSPDEGRKAIRELRRVTAPGGRGFISGNMLKADESENDCDPACMCSRHITAWPQDKLFDAVLEAGWKNPTASRLHEALQQYEWQWDCSVEA